MGGMEAADAARGRQREAASEASVRGERSEAERSGAERSEAERSKAERSGAKRERSELCECE